MDQGSNNYASRITHYALNAHRAYTAGCDEAGRGPLAGPVFAAAVVLPDEYDIEGLDDSKKLTPARRRALRLLIQQQAVAWGVASCSPAEIDQINILRASIRAMHKALSLLNSQCPTLNALWRDDIGITAVSGGSTTDINMVLVDGNRFEPWHEVPYRTIVHGDALEPCISAASILAKTYHDDYMAGAHSHFPQYGWDRNQGYPTRAHREAIRQYGPSPLHRLTFRLLPDPTLFE